MRRREWSAIVAMLAVTMTAACGGGEKAPGTEGTPPETGAAATTPQPTTPPPAPTPANLPPGVTPEDVAAGQQLFGTVCAACHGPDAKGTQLAPNLTDAEWIDADGTFASIESTIKTGVPQPKQYPAPMPPMGGGNFTDQQVKQIAAYVWSLGGGK